MGISPLMWGKQGWHFIHYVALNYPDKPTEEDKKVYLDFLNNLENILPCPICGHHFKENMENHPPKMNSKMEFFNWTVDMHNFVNESNGKKKVSYEKALDELTKNPNYIRNGLALSIGLLALVLLSSKIVARITK
jgi:FAD-linked sulfhydryl oxidase